MSNGIAQSIAYKDPTKLIAPILGAGSGVLAKQLGASNAMAERASAAIGIAGDESLKRF